MDIKKINPERIVTAASNGLTRKETADELGITYQQLIRLTYEYNISKLFNASERKLRKESSIKREKAKFMMKRGLA